MSCQTKILQIEGNMGGGPYTVVDNGDCTFTVTDNASNESFTINTNCGNSVVTDQTNGTYLHDDGRGNITVIDPCASILEASCNLLTVNAGTTASITDAANGTATVAAGETIHFWSSDASVGIAVSQGSAIVDLTVAFDLATSVIGVDTNCIDITVTDNGDDTISISADPIIDPAADNQLTCTATGLYVPAPTISLVEDDTDCINVTIVDNGDGSYNIGAEPILDPAADNQLSCSAAGLYVPAGGVTLTVTDSNCIDMTLTGTGSAADPYNFTAAPIISAFAGNTLQCLADGLYSSGAVDSFFVGDLGGTITFSPGDTLGLSRALASTVAGFTATEGGVGDIITYSEYLTSLTYITAANRLVYVDENGTVNNIDLPDETFLANAEYFSATNTILLTMDDGITTYTLDLSDLEDSLVEFGTNTNPATHGFTWTGGDGVTVNWRETLTTFTATATGNQIGSYVNENNITTDVFESVTTVTDTITGNQIATYNDEAGGATSINETITTLVESNAPVNQASHSFTYTSENGTVRQVFEALTSLTLNGNSLEYIDENNATSTIDLCPVVQSCETDTTYVASVTDNQIGTYTNEAGTATIVYESLTGVTNIIAGNRIATHTNEAGTAVDISETITTLVDNANGSFTYTSENGTVTTWNETTTSYAQSGFSGGLSGRTIGVYTNEDAAAVNVQESITTLTDNANGSFTYISENGTSTTWNETTTTMSNFVTGNRIVTYTNEDGVTYDVNESITTVANTVAGHKIADYTNESGTAIDINETVTSLALNGFSLDYVDENGTTNNVALPLSVITVTAASGLWSHVAGGVTTNIYSTAAEGDNVLNIGANGGTYLTAAQLTAAVDFCSLSAAQITCMTQAIDFSQITQVQQDALATILADEIVNAIDWNNAISADAGNSITVGTDGKLYLTAGAVTVVSADANNIITAGTDGGAWLDATNVTAAVDFCNLTAAQITCMTQAIDFSQLTAAQQTALSTTLNIVDEVIENAGALAGAAPTDAQFGIDTTTGTLYYVSGGNWAAVPTGGGSGTNWFTADQTQTAARTHNQNGFNTTVNGINNLTFNSQDGNNSMVFDWDNSSRTYDYHTSGTRQSEFYNQPGNFYMYSQDSANGVYSSFGGGTADTYMLYTDSSGNASKFRLQGDKTVFQTEGGAPGGTPSTGDVWLYTVGGELFVRDQAGNSTQLSNHNSLGILDEFVDPLDNVAQFGRTFNDKFMNISYNFLDLAYVAIVDMANGAYKVYNKAREIIKTGKVEL